MDLELAAASLRADGSDVRILVKVLVDQLADALGSRLEVKRSGGRFRKSDEIRSIRIILDDDQFDAEVDDDSLRCTIGHSSGGIRIRSEKVDVDTWLSPPAHRRSRPRRPTARPSARHSRASSSEAPT